MMMQRSFCSDTPVRTLLPNNRNDMTMSPNSSACEGAKLPGESPRGIAPRGARRTVRDTLASYGSHQGATAQHGPVRKQVWRTAGSRHYPSPCTSNMIAQLLVFLVGPVNQFVIELADH